jgi:hypothetical protein
MLGIYSNEELLDEGREVFKDQKCLSRTAGAADVTFLPKWSEQQEPGGVN